MPVIAPNPGLSLELLARLTTALPLPDITSATASPMAPPTTSALTLPPSTASAQTAVPPGPMPPKQAGRMPDVVVFSSGPLRLLSDLASTGLRQLAVLLPVLDQAVREESVVPMGYLAKATAAAARQVGDGHGALIAEGPDRVAAALQDKPAQANATASDDTRQLLRTVARQIGAEMGPSLDTHADEALRTIARQIGSLEQPKRPSPTNSTEVAAADQPEDLPDLRADGRAARAGDPTDASPVERWLGEAKHVLRNAADTLERAEEQLRPLATADTGGNPIPIWTLTEVIAAQAQVAAAYANIGRTRIDARPGPAAMTGNFMSLPLDRIAGAAAGFGILLAVVSLWLLGGVWSVLSAIIALVGTVVWVWRILQASRGVVLDRRG